MLWFFFPYALEYKIYSQKLYHLLKLPLHSKANAYTYRHLFKILYANALSIGTCFRFYTQKRVEKKTKAFAYRIYSHFTQQWTILLFVELINGTYLRMYIFDFLIMIIVQWSLLGLFKKVKTLSLLKCSAQMALWPL